MVQDFTGSQPVRVLHVITRMVRGGAQENTLATVAGLNGGAWESSLVAGYAEGPEGSLEPECERQGVRLLRVPELVREIEPAADLVALRRLTRLMRKERPQIVHTHTSKAGILGRLAARRAKVPIIVHTPHGHVFHSYSNFFKSRAFVGVERGCARCADRLVALTPKERDEHLALGVGRPEQWDIIHSGIEFSQFEAWRVREQKQVRVELGLPLNATVIGCVGRLVPIKDHASLIDAFAVIARKVRNAQLVLVGDGPLQDELVARARSLGLRVGLGNASGKTSAPPTGEATVHFYGLRRDVPRYLRAMDLFVLCSLNEGMGRALVEAMSMELPCVATWVSGIPDVVDEGKTGLLVPPRAPDMLSGAIQSLLRDPARARAMGLRGRERALAGFSQASMLDSIERMYTQLLHERGLMAERTAHGSPSSARIPQAA